MLSIGMHKPRKIQSILESIEYLKNIIIILYILFYILHSHIFYAFFITYYYTIINIIFYALSLYF